jgi:hypothetical protein
MLTDTEHYSFPTWQFHHSVLRFTTPNVPHDTKWMKKTKVNSFNRDSHLMSDIHTVTVPLNKKRMSLSKLLTSCIINVTFSIRFNTLFPLHASQNSNLSYSG